MRKLSRHQRSAEAPDKQGTTGLTAVAPSFVFVTDPVRASDQHGDLDLQAEIAKPLRRGVPTGAGRARACARVRARESGGRSRPGRPEPGPNAMTIARGRAGTDMNRLALSGAPPNAMDRRLCASCQTDVRSRPRFSRPLRALEPSSHVPSAPSARVPTGAPRPRCRPLCGSPSRTRARTQEKSGRYAPARSCPERAKSWPPCSPRQPLRGRRSAP